MADTYEVSKKLWKSSMEKSVGARSLPKEEEDMEKSEGATKGRGDERAKAGDVTEAGEKRADVVDSASIPSDNKKEIAPTEGDAKEKKNPAGKADAATKGQGDERDKAGDTKEAGEKRATVEKSDDIEKCNLVAKKKAKIAEMVKSFVDNGREGDFFKFLKKAEPELARELPVTPELWKDYIANHAKEVNKGNPTWDSIPDDYLKKIK